MVRLTRGKTLTSGVVRLRNAHGSGTYACDDNRLGPTVEVTIPRHVMRQMGWRVGERVVVEALAGSGIVEIRLVKW